MVCPIQPVTVNYFELITLFSCIPYCAWVCFGFLGITLSILTLNQNSSLSIRIHPYGWTSDDGMNGRVTMHGMDDNIPLPIYKVVRRQRRRFNQSTFLAKHIFTQRCLGIFRHWNVCGGNSSNAISTCISRSDNQRKH